MVSYTSISVSKELHKKISMVCAIRGQKIQTFVEEIAKPYVDQYNIENALTKDYSKSPDESETMVPLNH